MASYKLKYTAEEIDGILESVDEKTIYDDATQSRHGLMSATDKTKLDALPSCTQIEESLQSKVDKVDGKGLSENDYTDEDKASVASAYHKPSSGIPKNDLAQGVQTSLGKADTALQSFTETDPTVPSWAKQLTKPSYTASEVGAVPVTRKVNGKALSSDITLGASDVGALPSNTSIPSKVSDLANDSGFSSVSINRKVSTGTNIADITIDGTTTHLYAPQGGSGGEENVIEAITMNGASVPVTNKTAAITETDPTVPSWAKQSTKPSYNYSEIGNTPDLSGFVTKSVNDLTNYYLKSETYTKTEVGDLISAIQQFHYEIYASLPQNGESNVLYLIGPTGSGSDKYEEYVYASNAFTKIGDTSIDLSGYVTTSALNTALQSYTTTSSLATVATSGSYNDLSNKPTIPEGAFIVTFTQTQQPQLDNDGVYVSIGTANYSSSQIAAEAAEGREVFITNEDIEWFAIASYITDEEVDYIYLDAYYENGLNAFLTCIVQEGTDVTVRNKGFQDVAFNGETDPVFTASAAYGITSSDITNWNNKGTYSKPSGGIPDSDIASASTWNAKYTKPSNGIPASDLASGVIPTVPTNVSAFTNDAGYLTQHQSLTNYVQKSQTAGLLKNDGTVDTNTYLTQHQDISGKADKTLVASSMPSGGFLPNTVYNLGTLSGNTTFSMASATDNTIANIWCWTFTTPSTAPTIAWPAAITGWSGGSQPTINASKSYEVTVMNGLATIIES